MSKITIDTQKVAGEMKNRLSKKEIEQCDGWTDTLMDILEDMYEIETAVNGELQ